MKTLEDAWRWYKDVQAALKRMQRIGEVWWDRIPWEEPPWKGDRHFIELEKERVVASAENGWRHLDDIAVVVLFSVFEAAVRGAILEQVAREEGRCRHRSIVDAIESAKDRIREGSFFAVLSPFKSLDGPLIEEVHQVRQFRNWVSHGKRGPRPPFVSPEVAYDRLSRCLPVLIPDAAFHATDEAAITTEPPR